jgi:general secretion pathway protein K
MTCRAPDARRRERGAALIIAMLVFALATTLVVAMSSEFTLFLKRGQNSFVSSQAQAYLRGGEELAGLALVEDLKEDEREKSVRDDLSELWAQEVLPYALDEGGWLTGRLEDLQGRFNINSVVGKAPADKQFTDAQEQFIRLLQTPEEPRVSEQDAVLILEALLDWLDEDSEPRDFGAEDGHYIDSEPSYRTGNGRMESVSELRLVAYMTPELYAALEPSLTVWGDSNTINIHTATEAVLRSINAAGELQPLSINEGEALASQREEAGFESVQAMLDSQVYAGRELDAALIARLGESSSWFLYSGEVEVADRVTRLYSVLHREGSVVRARQRVSGSL